MDPPFSGGNPNPHHADMSELSCRRDMILAVSNSEKLWLPESLAHGDSLLAEIEAVGVLSGSSIPNIYEAQGLSACPCGHRNY